MTPRALTTGTSPPRVLYAASECAPWAKTGGLGDVAAALPAALARRGLDVRVLLPFYPSVRAAVPNAPAVGRAFGAILREATLPSGVPAILLDAPEFFIREGGLYQGLDGHDWPDNAQRFGLLSRVAALLATDGSPLGWRPHLLHCNDWQTALAPAWLRFAPEPRAHTVVTVHNLAFQGLFPPDTLGTLDLPAETYAPERGEFYGQLSFLKAGFYYADAITTVSPTYAREIQGQPLGFGMEGLLSARRETLYGILNGIDTIAWDPSSDPLIAARYDHRHLEKKALNKRALQAAMNLPEETNRPIFGLVSRLTHQKGIDLLLAIADRVLALPAQLAVLGSGDRQLEESLRSLATARPDSVAVQVGFNENLAHMIEAGADLFLMPSRFEPCGLNQMYSQRYGTPPVAHATGGLADTIVDPGTTVPGNDASGFLFGEPTAMSFLAAIERAVTAYRNGAAWRQLQHNGMKKDFSWSASADRYETVYRSVCARNRGT